MSADGPDIRFTSDQVEAWRRDGGVVIERFFTPAECAAVVADFETVFGRTEGAEAPKDFKKPGEIGRFNRHQADLNDTIPFDCSPALNLIAVHPALMALARALLGTEDVLLYQGEVWAKFTGDADYDQDFHCDYGNHTLTAPSEDSRFNSLTTLCYFTDVSEAHGPAHFVPRPATEAIASPEMSLNRAASAGLQQKLAAAARSSAAPAGSIFPYTIDVWHRGTNLTAPRGRRFAVMASYHRADVPSVNRYAWPYYGFRPWRMIFEHASVDQLAMFGVQRPGHPFWTAETLRRTEARYPGWDSSPWRDALVRPRRKSSAAA
ncbi:MAG: phytanoyl-CoA dioxygenase family protein [Caulobacteraceae bacterium]|nr:phytanoyl-CoA dioxygenase family protein [Caulobacteraceae bacterium]